MKKIFTISILLLVSCYLQGQTTVQWNFGTSTPGSASPSSGTPVSNLIISDVSQGNNNGTTTMLTTVSVSSGYIGVSGSYNAGAAARIGAITTSAGGSAYFEFSLTPSSGYIVKLSDISFGSRSTSTAPQAYSLRYSTDNYSSNLAAGVLTNNSVWALKSNTGLNIYSTTDAAPLTFRIYGYNGTGSPASGTANWRIDDLSIIVLVSPLGSTFAQLTNGIATSPLTGSNTDKALIGFSLTSNGSPSFTAINIQTSSTTIGKLNNIKVFKSTDNDYSTAGDNTQVAGLTINQTASEIQISGLSQALSGTPTNFFIAVDIDAAVTAATPSVQPYFNESNITLSAGTINTLTINGTTYSFQQAILLAGMEEGALNYIEGSAPGIITSTTSINAAAANLANGTISISGNYQNGQDVLGFTDQNGITGSWNAATGILTISGISSVANYQTALRSITYQNTSFNPSTLQRTVSFIVNDGTNISNIVTRNISVTAVNNPPVLSGIEGTTLIYIAGPSKQITNSITATDLDNAAMANGTVQITGNYSNGLDQLLFTNQNGITGTWTPSSGTLTLAGTATLANYITALRSIRFQNSSLNASNLLRTVSYTVNDGTAASNTLTRDISVDNAPIISSIEGTQLTYNPGGPATSITGTISVNDVDNINLASAAVQMIGYYEYGKDVLSFTNANGITGNWDATTGIMTLTGTSSLANYQTALRNVKYQNTSASPVKLIRTIRFIVNDGIAESNALTRDINLGFTLPSLVGIESDALLYKQGDGEKNITNGITINSPSSPMIGSAVIQITGNYRNGEDVLICLSQNQIIAVWNAAVGKLELSWPSSIMNYQTALRSVTYKNISAPLNTLPRTVSFTISDGFNQSNTVTRTINISVLNIITVTPNNADGGTVAGGGTFFSGNSATVTATPKTGYTFVNWTEGGAIVSTNSSYTFTLNGDRNLVANFTLIKYTVTAQTNTAEGGTVTGGGVYEYGNAVTITAATKPGYDFSNWTENGVVISNSLSFTFVINSNRNFLATFTKVRVLSATPETMNASFNAGTASISVSNTGGGTMTWSAVSNVFWITITSGATGTNSGTVNISYAPNNSIARIGTITITADGVIGSPKIIEIRQAGRTTGVTDLNLGIPDNYQVEQNYPNPFNPTTIIRYGLPNESNVSVVVYNILGEEVVKLFEGIQNAGFHEINFNATNLTSGIYIYKVSAGNFTQTKKMLLMK